MIHNLQMPLQPKVCLMSKAIKTVSHCCTPSCSLGILMIKMHTDFIFVQKCSHCYQCHRILYGLIISVHVLGVTFMKKEGTGSRGSEYRLATLQYSSDQGNHLLRKDARL